MALGATELASDTTPVLVSAPDNPLTAFCGHYRCYSPWFTNFRVVLRGDRLLLIAPGGVEAPATRPNSCRSVRRCSESAPMNGYPNASRSGRRSTGPHPGRIAAVAATLVPLPSDSRPNPVTEKRDDREPRALGRVRLG